MNQWIDLIAHVAQVLVWISGMYFMGKAILGRTP